MRRGEEESQIELMTPLLFFSCKKLEAAAEESEI